jgi:virginiamycin B lyase
MINEDPIPLDETALAKAQYVEFLLPLDDKRPKRWVQEVHIDFDGNVWYTERTLPNAVGRLDPRTGTVIEWELPDPDADPHGMTIDSEGYVYWAEVDEPYLGRLDPRTGEMNRYPYDESGELGRLGGHTPVLDSEENVWFTLIYGDALGKWDRRTEKISIWRVPTPRSMPYGLDIGPNDKPVLAGMYGCHVVSFDATTEKFTEYPALVEPPCVTRRLGVDSDNIIWYGVFSRGKLGRIDPESGAIQEYDMASRFSEPYDVWSERGSNRIWISDAGQGGAIVQFDSETERFTHYPAPRRSDMPKMDVSGDGHVWYPVRAVPDGAVGVLLPDKHSVATLAAKR